MAASVSKVASETHEDAGLPLSKAEARWQKQLLPLMSGMLIALTAFFFVASFLQLYYLQNRIEHAPQLDLGPAMANLDSLESELSKSGVRDEAVIERRIEAAKWRSLLLLESNVMQRRYHQAGVLLISRIWTRYLGFVTGTMLALVGAAFILGKLRESSSTVGAESSAWKVSVTSASPGLILAVLGTTLMLGTMATRLELQVTDGPVYLPMSGGIVAPAAPLPLQPQTGQKPGPTDKDLLKQMQSEGGAAK
jgi:hypothetical protein